MGWNLVRKSRPLVHSSVPNFTPSGAACRPCGAKNLKIDLWRRFALRAMLPVMAKVLYHVYWTINLFQWMAAGQNGRHGTQRVHLVGAVLRQDTVFALIHHRYMVVPTAVGSHRKLRTAIYLPVQVIIIIISSLSVASSLIGVGAFRFSKRSSC